MEMSTVFHVLHTCVSVMEKLQSASYYHFQNYKRQAVCALGLFARMAAHCDIAEETHMVPLLVNLWNLANKHAVLDKRLMVCMAQGKL